MGFSSYICNPAGKKAGCFLKVCEEKNSSKKVKITLDMNTK